MISFRVSEDEHAEIERRARLQGVSISDYMRGLILNEVILKGANILCPSLSKDGYCVKKSKSGIPIFKKTSVARCIACQKVETPIDKATKEKYEQKIERLSKETAKIIDSYKTENANLKNLNTALLDEKVTLLKKAENLEITLKETEFKLKTTEEELCKAKQDLETVSSGRLFEENQKLKVDVAQHKETIRNLEKESTN
jgi:uncharacterized Zn finger protein (UPF0148 family)